MTTKKAFPDKSFPATVTFRPDQFATVRRLQDQRKLSEVCQKAVDEDRKVLLGFTLSNLSTDIFTLNKGEHAGEQRVSLKARLIKVDWIKIGQEMVYKAEKSDSQPPQNGTMQQQYAENSF